jgi:hypothetical protein
MKVIDGILQVFGRRPPPALQSFSREDGSIVSFSTEEWKLTYKNRRGKTGIAWASSLVGVRQLIQELKSYGSNSFQYVRVK